MSNTTVLTDESFESILLRITKTQGEKRKLVCQAFRASLADIMNSKSTARVNAFARVPYSQSLQRCSPGQDQSG